MFDCTHVKDIWLFVFDEFQKLTGFHFVPTLRSSILGTNDVNVENSRIINTIMLLAKMYIMKCTFSKETSSTTFQLYSCFIRRFISNWSFNASNTVQGCACLYRYLHAYSLCSGCVIKWFTIFRLCMYMLARTCMQHRVRHIHTGTYILLVRVF